MSLASSWGNTIGGSVLFIGDRGKSNIWGGVNISLYISTSIASGSVAMSSADADSSGIGEALRLNNGD